MDRNGDEILQKISICTVCMNRLHHIKDTLPKNIEDNKDYDNVEFVVLDYNSSDNLREWIETTFSDELRSGVLKFYRTEHSPFFDRSHSRNMAFRLATGDVICNVDADNFTGTGYAEFVNTKFNTEQKMFLVADTKKQFYFLRNAFGRFCVKKEDLLKVGGVDERMVSYGSETVDLYERLKKNGLREIIIRDTNFLRAISHGDEERVENEYFLKELKGVYINFISHESSRFLILFKNSTFEMGEFIPEYTEMHLPAALKEDSFEKGCYSETDKNISIEKGEKIDVDKLTDNHLRIGRDTYYNIDNQAFLNDFAKNYSFIVNNVQMKDNAEDKKVEVNNVGFGRGKVFSIAEKTYKSL